MNLKPIRDKLVGSEEQRAVSPVIGVILMVAITVILAAVIATFVLDMGGSLGQEAQGAASFTIDNSTDSPAVEMEVTSLQNADHIELSGDVDLASTEEYQVGDTVQLEYDKDNPDTDDLDGNSGTVTAVAVLEQDGETIRTTVASKEFDFSDH